MASPALPLRITTVILLALVAGLSLFAGIVVFLRLGNQGELALDPEVGRTLLLVLAGMALAEIPAYLVLRRVFRAEARAEKDEGLALLRQGLTPRPLFTLALVGAAMVEGVGLLGVVAVLVGAPLYALAIPALAAALILAQIPTRERLEQAVRGD